MTSSEPRRWRRWIEGCSKGVGTLASGLWSRTTSMPWANACMAQTPGTGRAQCASRVLERRASTCVADARIDLRAVPGELLGRVPQAHEYGPPPQEQRLVFAQPRSLDPLGTVLRSDRPDGVIQEFHGCMDARDTIHCLLHDPALDEGLSVPSGARLPVPLTP